MSRRVAILGCTGSVGESTLALLAEARASGAADFEMAALVAGGRNLERLADQARLWRPAQVVVAEEAAREPLSRLLAGEGLAISAGAEAVNEAAASADWTMCAIVGAAGVRSTFAAARSGAVVALANKESLVCAGPLLMAEAERAGGTVVPVDSEHSAVFQILPREHAARVDRVILTCSGGPFRERSRAEMASATPEEAVAHPKWSMGSKISVDSATLMNKGLELIEASYLFGLNADQLEVLIHPESIVHSLVRYRDGSTLAQLGEPDMRTPIAVAWAWPDRLVWNAPQLDLAAHGSLTFSAPDAERFPALRLARAALEAGGGAPAILNAANEVAVAAFLARRLAFLDIAAIVEETLTLCAPNRTSLDGLDGALEADAEARRVADAIVAGRAAA